MTKKRARQRATPGEGSVRWVASRQRFRVRVPVGGRHVERWTRTREQGEAVRLELVRERDQPAAPPARRTPESERTVADLCAVWLRDVVPADVSPSTRRVYRDAITYRIVPVLGHIPLVALHPSHVQAWLADLRTAPTRRGGTGYSPNTVTTAHAILRMALGVAEDWEWVSRNVAKRARGPGTRPVTELTAPSPAEVQAILRATAETEIALPILLCAVYGVRQSEALALRWVDVAEDALTFAGQIARGSRAYVPTKTRDRRRLPMVQLVARAIESAPRRSDMYVTSTEDGRPLSQTYLYHAYVAAERAAGLPHRRIHDLRRGVASTLAALGVPEIVSMAILGHHSREIHRHYQQVSEAQIRDALTRFSEELG